MRIKKSGTAPSAGAIYCLTSIITKAVTLATTPIFTRIMNSEEYGKYILYISLYGICVAAASVGASSGVIYNVYSEREDKIREISFAGFLTSIPITAVVCILLFAFSNILKLQSEALPLLFIHTVLDVLISSYLLKFRYVYKAFWIFTVEVVKSVGSVLLSYYLVSSLGFGYIGRVLGFVLTLAPIALLTLFFFGRSLFRIPYPIMSRVTKNALPASVSALFLSIGVYLVNIVISVSLGKESLAVFSIFNTVATSPVFLITALIAALAPSIQRETESRSIEKIRDMYCSSSALISAIIMLVSLISKEALAFLAPESYDADLFIILPLLLYSQLKLSDQFLSCVLNAKRIYRYSLISNVIFSSATLAVLLLLLRVIGLFAAGLSLLIGVALSVMHKLMHITGGSLSVLSVGDLISSFVGVLGFCFLALSLSDMPALRTLLAIIPAIRLLNVYYQRPHSKPGIINE